MKQKILSMIIAMFMVFSVTGFFPQTAEHVEAATKGTADAFVNEALKYEEGMSLAQTKKAMKKNHGKILHDSDYRGAWCMWFVVNCAKYAGMKGIKAQNGCHRDSYKKNGTYRKSKAYGGSYIPKKGDLIFFDWYHTDYAWHVGIVRNSREEIKKTKIIKTIEGNSSSVIKRRSWSINSSYVLGYVNLGVESCKTHNWVDKDKKYCGKCQNCGVYYKDIDKVNTSSKSTETKYYRFKTATNIKAYPHTGSNTRIAKVKASGTVEVLGTVTNESTGWYKVRSGSDLGYVLKSAVEGPLTATKDTSKLSVKVGNISMKEGKSQMISGSVTSNYTITKVTGSVSGQTQTITKKEFGNGRKTVYLQGSLIDKNLRCDKLDAGTYTLTVTAWDVSGNKKSGTATITVNGSVKMPTIGSEKAETGGKTVTIKQNESGATLWYKIGSQAAKSTTAASKTTPVIKTEGTTQIKAWSKKGSSTSATVTKAVTVSRLGIPSVDERQEGAKIDATIIVGSGVKVMYRKGSDDYSPYNGKTITLEKGEKINYYAVKSGSINSSVGTYEAGPTEPDTPDVRLLNTESRIAAGKTVTFGWKEDSKADSYTAVLHSGEDDSEIETKETKQATVSFSLKDAGRYYVVVTAKNDIGESEESSRADAEAKNPQKVIFRDVADGDKEGAVLNEMTVEYGGSLGAVEPPSRKGYEFKGWRNEADETVSQNGYQKTSIKEDRTYTAVYEKKSYKVKMYDTEGKLLKTKTVQYDEALDTADETAQIKVEEGYEFAGWQVTGTADSDSRADIAHIDSDMEVKAVVAWSEKELPVKISFSKEPEVVKRENSEYIEATVSLKNDRSQELSMYLIYALKATDTSDENKATVAYVDRKVVELPAGSGSDDPEKKVSLRIKIDDVKNVNKLEVTAVKRNNDMSTGCAYSASASTDVTIRSDYGEWSEWSDTKYEGTDDRQVETRTVYRYRDKSYKYSGQDTLSGYTKEGTEYYNFKTEKYQSTRDDNCTRYGNFWMSAPDKTTNIYDGHKDVNSYTTTTAQRSYAYVSGKKDWYYTNSSGTSKSGQKTSNLLTVYSSRSLKSSGYTKDSDGSYGLPKTISTGTSTKLGTIYRIDYAGAARVDTFTSGTAKTWLWPHSSATRTLYRPTTVRTRSKLWKWNNWSAWGTAVYTKSSTREVEQKTQYRYRDRVTESVTGVEVKGTTYSFASTENDAFRDIGLDLAGKKATIMVYQANNTDPNRYQMKYVGQTEMKDGNAYDFSFMLGEGSEPTRETGNYIVSLAVQGTTGLVNVGVIEAPKEEYRVKLYYLTEDDQKEYIAEDLTVKEHGDVDLSSIKIPERDGYVFLGWRNRTTDVTEDCTTTVTENGKEIKVYEIEAAYAPLQNAVVFVDWLSQKLEIQNLATGSLIDIPESTESAEGYVFKGWKLEDGSDLTEGTKVTGNMVITAEYEPIKYTVRFIGLDGSEVDTQEVAYGSAATPPEYTAPEGKGTFTGWSTDVNWWNVKEDVDVRAMSSYTEQAQKPTSKLVIDEETEARSLELATEEENGTIYYTTDGTTPTADLIQEYRESDGKNCKGSVQEYTSPITFDEATAGEAGSDAAADAATDAEAEEAQTYMNVVAVTYAEGKDLSEECAALFEKDPDEEEADDNISSEWEQIGEYEVKASAGKDVRLKIDLEDNPGLTGYDFLIESDKDVFYADDDEYGAPEVDSGTISQSGTVSTTDTEGGWRVNWNSIEGSKETGNLFTLTLHVEENAEEGTYPVTVSYAPENTLNEDYDTTELSSVRVSIDSDASIKLETKEINLARTSYEYEGKAIEPAVSIDGLKEGTDYTVAYENNINAGTAKAVITGKGDYAGTVEKEFTITQANIANADIGKISDQTVTGEAIEPELEMSYNGTQLRKSEDYDVEFANNKETGTATVKITGKGNFRGTTETRFNITETLESKLEKAKAELEKLKKEKAEAEAKLAEAEKATAEAEAARKKAEEARAEAEKNLEEAKKAEAQAVTEKEAAEAAKATAEAETAKAKAEAEAARAEADVAKASQKEAEAKAEAAENKQKILETELQTAKTEKETAEKQAELYKAGKENAEAQVEAAKAAQEAAEAEARSAKAAKEAAELQEKNTKSKLAEAEAELEKAVAAKEAAEADSKASAEARAEAEKRAEEAEKAKAELEKELKETKEAKETAEKELKAAEAAKAEAEANLKKTEEESAAKIEQLRKEKEAAEKALEEALKGKEEKISIADAKISGISTRTYTGKAQKQIPTVKVSGEELEYGTDYTVSWKNNVNVGKAAVQITGAGKYTGSISRTFSINPKGTKVTKLTKGKKQLTVRWTKQATQTTGYQLQYGTAKSFRSGTKTVKVSSAKSTTKKLTKLKTGKKYYVRIRTYKTVSGKTYYSSWSKALSAKVK